MKLFDKHNLTMFTLTALACATALVVVVPLWNYIKGKFPTTQTTPSSAS